MLGWPSTINSTPPMRLDPREFTIQHLRRWADLTEEADTSDFGLELSFAITGSGRVTRDHLAGDAGGNWATAECIGATLSDRGEVALTREQVRDLIGADHVAEAERRAAEKYADGMGA